MGNMTHPADAEYIGILETVVAVLAVKLGMHPEVTMGNAIREISAQAGLETIDSDALIQSRWSGRNVNQIVHVAQRISNAAVHDIRGVQNRSSVNDSATDNNSEAGLSMAERLQKRKERRGYTESDTIADTGSDTESTTV